MLAYKISYIFLMSWVALVLGLVALFFVFAAFKAFGWKHGETAMLITASFLNVLFFNIAARHDKTQEFVETESPLIDVLEGEDLINVLEGEDIIYFSELPIGAKFYYAYWPEKLLQKTSENHAESNRGTLYEFRDNHICLSEDEYSKRELEEWKMCN